MTARRRIRLTRSEVIDLLATLEDARVALTGSDLLGLVLELEDAHTRLLDKLYPNAK